MRAATNPIVLAAPDLSCCGGDWLSACGSVADRLTISNRLCGRNRRGAAFVRRRVGLWRMCEQWRARCFGLRHLSFGGRGLGLGRRGFRLGGYGAARRAGAGRPAAAARRGGLSVDLRRISFKGEFGSLFRVGLGCDSGRVFLRFTRFGAPALTSTFGGFGRRLLNWLFYWERRSLDDILDRIGLQPSRRVRRLRLDVAAKRKIRLWQPLDRRLRGCDHRLKLPDPGHHLKGIVRRLRRIRRDPRTFAVAAAAAPAPASAPASAIGLAFAFALTPFGAFVAALLVPAGLDRDRAADDVDVLNLGGFDGCLVGEFIGRNALRFGCGERQRLMAAGGRFAALQRVVDIADQAVVGVDRDGDSETTFEFAQMRALFI